jgi:opacity protein-like surface antigen
MKKEISVVALAAALMISAYAADDQDKKLAVAESAGTAIKGTAPNGESVLIVERSTPKVVGIVPPGWKVVPLEGAKIESDAIEIHPGLSSVITLSPYKLVPDPKRFPFGIKEPGFDSSLGNQQASTVGAILSNYAREEQKLDEKLGSVIDQLRTALNQISATPNETARQQLTQGQRYRRHQPQGHQ